MTRVLAAFALLLSLAGGAGAQDAVAERERAVHAAVLARQAAERERAAAGAEAAALADDIARRKAGSDAVRAEGALADRLRAFDRKAAALDALDRKVEVASAAVDQAQRAFEQAADARLEALAAHADAAGTAALEAARDRVRAATEAPGFRPPLDVRRGPGDGPAEIEGKLQLLDAERRRLAEEQARLDAEDLVLVERLAGKRRLAASLAAARREAAVPLLARESDEIRRVVARLTREREALARARTLRSDAQRAVDAMMRELAAR